MHTIKQLANWKTILPLFTIFILFSFYLFPKYQAKINLIAGIEIQSLDARFTYSNNDVIALFDTITTEGRQLYFFISSQLDAFYPLVYGLLLFFIILNLTRNLSGKWFYISFIPFISILFDYLENIHVQNLLTNYPSISTSMVKSSALMTQLKWSFFSLSLLIVLVFFIFLGLKKIRSQYITSSSK